MSEEEIVDKIAEWIARGNVYDKGGDILFHDYNLKELAKALTKGTNEL